MPTRDLVMRSYDPAGWEPFFTAVIAAAAALTGLLFVAVSINLDRIVKGGTNLTARAAETLAVLLFVLVSSALTLVPQSTLLLGIEILVVVVPMLAVTLSSQIRWLRQSSRVPVSWSVSRMACTAVVTVPGAIAGLTLAIRAGGGLYWLVPTVLLGIVAAVYNAWVLLVEILR